MRISRPQRWQTAFSALKTYRKQNPATWPVPSYIAPSSLRLGLWCLYQRNRRRKNRLSRDRIQRLRGIGFPWRGVSLAGRWDRNFEELKSFRQKHGHCRPPRGYRTGGVSRASWCDLQRKHRRAGKLGDDRVAKLNVLGLNGCLSRIDGKKDSERLNATGGIIPTNGRRSTARCRTDTNWGTGASSSAGSKGRGCSRRTASESWTPSASNGSRKKRFGRKDSQL